MPLHQAPHNYALGLGAGTQAFTHIPWLLFPGIHGGLARTLCMAAGWALNLVVAEWLISRAPEELSRKGCEAVALLCERPEGCVKWSPTRRSARTPIITRTSNGICRRTPIHAPRRKYPWGADFRHASPEDRLAIGSGSRRSIDDRCTAT